MEERAPGDMVATGIGSLPHLAAEEAVEAVLAAFPELPYWPQLPRRAPEENMYRQFLTGMPGLSEEGGRPSVADSGRFWREFEGLLAAFTAGDDSPGGIPRDRAAGLHALLERGGGLGAAVAVKGQVTGPVSMGLSLPGPGGGPALYDEGLMEALVMLLQLKVRWQERLLRRLHPVTLVFLDEPYLGTMGSGFYAYDAAQARGWLERVLAGAEGLTGIHCCANTDWGLLLDLDIDVISFDAYGYFENFALYAPALGRFLARGGRVAWGIVPADGEAVRGESVESLLERLTGYVDALAEAGVPRELLVRQSLLTPSCGLGALRVEDAERVLALCRDLSRLARERLVT